MPRYDYRCHTCGEVFEVKQKFSDAPLTVHEKCGGPVERLVSVPALQFKGSGWYVTDYARGGSSGANGKSEAKADTKAETKSDAKPADSKPAAKATPES